ncbi:uncharacterized protein LOC113336929 [Papaver somniferum]|uniref:uncharacterized protein LOC113336929 n=1 Tax=Papaver somniferum TaxID=3469 RepID=UPI000E702A95|nr:uncharacterized protein LOC113336929 [Papaver somniferum]
MADDDEDEGFGDFKFVAYSANSNQISTNKTDNNDDDDWGDFVDNFSSPKQDLNHQTHPIQNFDFFGGLSDQKPIQTQPISKPNLERKNSVSNSPVWEKPKGALPLSLFGDDEEEEQEEEEVQKFDQRKGFSSSFGDFSRNTQSPVKIEPNSGSGFAIKDIIVNLYTQSDQIKTEENLKADQIGNQNGDLEDDDYDDEDGWEFKDASVDNRPEVSSPELKAEVKSSENANGVNGGADWFVASNELKPTEMENGLVYELGGGATAERIFAFDPLSQSKNIGVENGNSNLVADEDFADFQDSFFSTGAANYSSTQKEELKMGDHSRVQGRELMFADAFHANGYESWDNQKAVPASHFSNGKLDSETSLFREDLFSNKHLTSVGNQAELPALNFSNGKLDSETSLFGEDLSSNKPLTSIDNQGALPASSFSNGKLDSQASLFGEDLSSNKPLTSIDNQGALPALNFSNGKLGSPASLFGEEDLFADKPSTSRSSQGASPISNFSNAKLDSAGSLFGDDLFSYKPSNSQSNGLHNKVGNSNFVFNDLISNLYSQTEHAPAVQEATENRYDSSQANLSTDLGNDEDDFDENAWEFRAAPSKSFIHEATENGFDSFQTNLSPDLANGENDFDENAWEFRAAPPKSFVHEATENGFDSFQTNLSPDLANGEDDFDEDAWEFRAAPSHSLVETRSADALQKNPAQEATENGYKFVQIAKNSNLVNGGDYFDGNSWDFEGSLSEVKVESGPGDPLQKNSTASKPPVLSSQGATQNGFDLVDMFANANEANGNNDFAENSWDKGALSEGYSKTDSGDTLRKFPTESKLNTYIDFYRRLKEESYYLALHHLDALKKAKTAAALSSDNTKAEEIRHEIQEAYKILHREGLNSETVNTDGRQPTKGYTKELLVLMKEPVIQMLDSEFNMSSRVSLAEKSLNSTIGIFEHSILMSKILTLGSMEDQFACITKWSQILTACSQELKHGAFIWKQSLEKKVNQQILSKSKGQQYILSLGEIYRVVEVVRISTKLYWPWIVSTLANPAEIIALLEECSAAWLDSKLEDALLSFSDEVGVGYAAKILVESLKSIHNLDASTLQKQVLQEPICSISLVSLKAVSGMKEVVWNGEHFFLPLANLWSNLISSYPPKLPHIYAIS